MRIDLFHLGALELPAPRWGLGRVWPVLNQPRAIAEATAGRQEADAFLFWDATLGAPEEARVLEAMNVPGDVWHAGLVLGMGGQPCMIDFVDPVWRFNRDPEPGTIATSWRLSLRACLARAAVLNRLGGPDPHFESVTGASLELGHRWIRRGAMMWHTANFLPDAAPDESPVELSLFDQIRFLRLRYGRVWAGWAGWRYWRRHGKAGDVIRALRRPHASGVVAPAAFLHELAADRQPMMADFRPAVSILIPTLDRYPHLFNLLDQLRDQTVPPLEIIVVDQTGRTVHDTEWPERFSDLPLRIIRRDEAGQCTSRNAGLRQARGEAVLFLDDDDEVPPDLIARHLEFLARFDVDASCGTAEEAGAGALPPEFSIIRNSDVFPTNNSLLKMAALSGSGLFDLAYEKGERADHDLGMRLYLSGASMALNPSASVIHLHAPRGGLRQHKARVITRSSSRASIRHRQFLAPTEAYLMYRYFTESQVAEAALIRTVGTLKGSGSAGRRLLRALVMLVILPDTRRQNRERLTAGRAMLQTYPNIPDYSPALIEELLT